MSILNLKCKTHKLINLLFYGVVFVIGFLIGSGAKNIKIEDIISKVLFIDNVNALTSIDSDKNIYYYYTQLSNSTEKNFNDFASSTSNNVSIIKNDRILGSLLWFDGLSYSANDTIYLKIVYTIWHQNSIKLQLDNEVNLDHFNNIISIYRVNNSSTDWNTTFYSTNISSNLTNYNNYSTVTVTFNIPVNSSGTGFRISWGNSNDNNWLLFNRQSDYGYTFGVTDIQYQLLQDNQQAIIDQNQTIINQNEQITNGIQDVNTSINNMGDNISNAIKDEFNSCRDSVNLFDKNNFEKGYAFINSTKTANANWGIYWYLAKPNTTYTISGLKNYAGTDIVYTDSNKNVLNVLAYRNGGTKYTFTTGSESGYIGVSFVWSNSASQGSSADTIQLQEGSVATSYENYGEQICTNKIDDTNNKLDDLNNSINDSNVDGANGIANNFFNSFENNDYGLSDIITIPLSTISKITSGTCTPINAKLPYVDKTINLPCLGEVYEEKFPTFLLFYNIVMYGFISYWVVVQVYALVKGFKDPDNDKIEVADL